MLIDAHAHVGDWLFGDAQSPEDLLAAMDAHGVTRAIISPLKPRSYHFGPQNDLVADAVRRHPGRFVGFARVDPWQRDEAVAEARRAFDDLGLVGLFLHPFEEQFTANDEIVFPIVALLRERELPLMVAGGYRGFSHPTQIGDLAREFPDVTIIATHGGQLNISGMLLNDAMRMFRARPNVYLETSGVYREDFIEDFITELGPERVVFGSNSPYMDLGFETLRVHRAHTTNEVKSAIGGGNIARIVTLTP